MQRISPRSLLILTALMLPAVAKSQTFLKPVPRGGLEEAEFISPPADGQFFIEIQAPANQPLDEAMNDPVYQGDDLAELPTGEFKTDQGVRFQIGKQLIALRGKFAPQRPERIRIKVDRRASSLYFLQACGWGAFGGPGNEHFEKDGTLIGYYRVNYEDQDYEVIPIVYGKDVRDWWGIWDKFAPTRNGDVVWRGTNKHLRGRQEAAGEPQPLRLFQAKWVNPWPTLKISSIDYVSTQGTAAPFCLAMTGYLSSQENPRANPGRGAAEDAEELRKLSRKGESGYRAIYTLSAEGTDLQFLFSAPGMISTATPDLSHDGRMLLCDALPFLDAVDHSRIFMTTFEGPFKGVVRDLWYGNTPVWSPDDKRIAFMLNPGNPAGEASGIWLMNADGSDRKHLGEGIYPQWSPDGERICADVSGNLAIYQVKTGESRRVLADPLSSGFGGATWSADGKQLVFILNRNGKSEIALMDPAGSADSIRTLYVEENAQKKLVGPPSLSPDGKRVVFAIQDPAANPTPDRQWLNTSLYVTNVNSPGEAKPLEAGQPGKINRGMRWSRDGGRILFSSER